MAIAIAFRGDDAAIVMPVGDLQIALILGQVDDVHAGDMRRGRDRGRDRDHLGRIGAGGRGIAGGLGLGHHHGILDHGGLGLRAIVAARFAPRAVVFLVLGAGQRALFLKQRLTVGDGDLVIIGVDLGESEEPVAIATVIDKGRLERRLHPRDLGQIDVTLKLPLVYIFKVEFVDPVSVHHDHTGFFRVGGVDKHFLCHVFPLRHGRPCPGSRSGGEAPIGGETCGWRLVRARPSGGLPQRSRPGGIAAPGPLIVTTFARLIAVLISRHHGDTALPLVRARWPAETGPWGKWLALRPGLPQEEALSDRWPEPRIRRRN